MSAHTTGPWIVTGKQTIRSDSDGDFLVANANWRNGEANARLIAAAPELLEALRGLYEDQMDYLRINHLGGENNHWMVAARSAIAKAEGRS